MKTPWGKPERTITVAKGIKWISTASHGGYWLSHERMLQMPEHLRKCSYTGDNFFEEDCSWCAVVLAFPYVFGAQDYAQAKSIYENFYAKKEAA